jgi:PadR family transcriptional regulator, regulatory protein PadR
MSVHDKRDPKNSSLLREVLLNFWKIHILHHAAEGTVYGQWMIEELRRHGYDISPGTLYPLLRRMETHGWLERTGPVPANSHSRKEYRLTKLGADALDVIEAQLRELYREVVGEKKRGARFNKAASKWMKNAQLKNP